MGMPMYSQNNLHNITIDNPHKYGNTTSMGFDSKKSSNAGLFSPQG
jgi:hypothetical protein